MAVPQFEGGKLLTGHGGYKPRPVVERTEMETGPVKQRRKQTRTMVERPCTYVFSNEEFADFLEWFYEDIAMGTAWFDWENDPYLDPPATREARIVGGDFDANPLGSRTSHVSVTFTLEHYHD